MGKTQAPVRRMRRGRKHPHMRGEDTPIGMVRMARVETPPHAWGRPLPYSARSSLERNTPTCVGKTVKAHPSKDDWTETPPHAWGRPAVAHPEFTPTGNTPTCVGKTVTSLRVRFGFRKHPHMRGEDESYALADIIERETPPHAWGRPVFRCRLQSGQGNTPTCVGKTHGGI